MRTTATSSSLPALAQPVVMVFDIETIPDVVAGRRLLGLADTVSAAEVADQLKARRLAQTQQNSDFLPHYLQKIVAISVLLSGPQGLKVWSLGQPETSESGLITRFFDCVERYTPTLISWNGGGFDLPVLHYRALFQGVQATRYWEQGGIDPAFKWNNYLSRYHQRHLDLMDVLSGYQGRAAAPLTEIALLLGWPGKMGEAGGQVWDKYLAGDVVGIRQYCETDVVNTYGVYLAFQKMRGILDEAAYQAEKQRLIDCLQASSEPHWPLFLESMTHAIA